MPLDLSTPEKEGQLQVSKSRKLPILLDTSEMQALFQNLEPFHIFDVARPVNLDEAEISKEDFLKSYALYIQGIKEGNLIEENLPLFSSIFTSSPEVLYAMELKNGKVLIKPRLPVVQLQRHHFVYSDAFHSGVMGTDSITWGIQFSYPQLYLDPKTKSIGKVDRSEKFPNTLLFQRLAKWVRDHTSATPFEIEGKKVNQPMRLGKNSFSWINQHPGLKKKGLHVEPRKNPSNAH
ncbi:MAG: hypothetical protein P0S96_07140 [Simkaniaceae bacterium]|nr:hypothetical protein [Candidatus Sacchlamyda saccharinae]